jgi:DNA-binding transcriptional ArsR family regulator
MNADVNIAAVAALIADPTRAAFLDELLDGRALPAGELARRAGVTASTASTHLARLVEGGLIAVERSGRHRYFRLADPTVAHALEALAAVAPPKPVRSLRQSNLSAALRSGRTCYDHLAGLLGVQLTQALLELGWLAQGETAFTLTPKGEDRLTAFGLDLPTLKRSRRAFAPRCLDWSERRHHLAGALGAALLHRLLDLGWIVRTEASRAVKVTPEGRERLRRQFSLDLP